MNDALSLANGGYAPVDRFFMLVDRIPADADPLVWQLAAGQLAGIYANLDGDPAQPAMGAKVRQVLTPQLARVGLLPKAGEPSNVSQLREALVAIMGRVGDPTILAAARKYAEGDMSAIPAAIREAVLSVYAYNATPAQWERIHQAALTEKDPAAQRSYWSGLGAVKDEALARKTLALALTEEASVPNRANLIRGVASEHSAMAFDWAVEHADAVNALVEASSRPRYIPALAGGASDPAVADRVAAYAEKALPPQSRQGAQTAAAAIRYRAKLRGIQAAPAAAWAKGAK